MKSTVSTATPSSLVFRLPLLGAMLRDAVFGHDDAKYYFIANVLITLFWATYLYGYPFVIVAAEIGAVAVLSTIVALTSMDLWQNRGKRQARRVKSEAVKKHL